MHSISFRTPSLLSHIVYILQVYTKIFFARIYCTRARAGAFHICDWEKIGRKIFWKKLLTFCSTFDIIHHVNRTTTRFEKIGRRSVEKSTWHMTPCVVQWVQRNREHTPTANRAFELMVLSSGVLLVKLYHFARRRVYARCTASSLPCVCTAGVRKFIHRHGRKEKRKTPKLFLDTWHHVW